MDSNSSIKHQNTHGFNSGIKKMVTNRYENYFNKKKKKTSAFQNIIFSNYMIVQGYMRITTILRVPKWH